MATIKNKLLIRKSTNKVILKKTALLSLGCILMLSCINSTIVPIVDLDQIDHSISFDITDVLEDISIVQINSDFLLSVYDEIYLTSQYMICHINGKFLHLFNREGEHIRKLAERGNGPGEFSRILYFFADEEERILYYVDQRNIRRLNRIDISSGKVLDPLPIDFYTLSTDYINGKMYCFPKYYVDISTDIAFFPAGGYPDSTIVFSISLPSAQMDMIKSQRKYPFLVLGTSITSYKDEVILLNLGYSDTLFTLKDNILRPLCVLRFSNKRINDKDGVIYQITSAYNNGIVFTKIGAEAGREFFLYDRGKKVVKIDNTLVMNTQIDHTASKRSWRFSALLPITCGKYGYMLIEHNDIPLPASYDPDNDNPIIITGTLK